jgi:hypothetical protein
MLEEFNMLRVIQGHGAVVLNVLSSSVFIYRACCCRKPDNLLEWKFEFLMIVYYNFFSRAGLGNYFGWQTYHQVKYPFQAIHFYSYKIVNFQFMPPIFTCW